MKRWYEYSEEEQAFWNKWWKVELLTLSPNKHEAFAAASKANQMLMERDLTRKDIPTRCLRILEGMGVRPIIRGRRKSGIGVVQEGARGKKQKRA